MEIKKQLDTHSLCYESDLLNRKMEEYVAEVTLPTRTLENRTPRAVTGRDGYAIMTDILGHDDRAHYN